MSRPISEDDLHAQVDGALPASRRAEVEDYLASNPEVALRIAMFSRQREALRSALLPIAAEPVPPQLNVSHIATPPKRSRSPAWRSAVAACLLLLVGGAGGWTLHDVGAGQNVGIDALANEASYAYAVFGPDPARAVEIPAAQGATLTRWMENRLQRPVTMPDLNRAGLTLMGGRVVATENGPAGLLMYTDAHGRRIGMLMRPMIKRDQNAKMRQHVEGGVVGFSWADNGMGYSMVGDVAATFLHPLADEARRQLRPQT